VTLDAGLAAECAGVSGVLGDFHLLHLLTEGGTISVQIESATIHRSRTGDRKPLCRNCCRGQENLIAYLVPYLPVTPTSVYLISSKYCFEIAYFLTLCALGHFVGMWVSRLLVVSVVTSLRLLAF